MKTQVWIAAAVYVLITIVRKRLQLGASLYELLQMLSVTLFEQPALECVLRRQALLESITEDANQWIMFTD